MGQLRIFGLALAAALVVTSAVASAQTQEKVARPFAVVELFTSQGCNSCPSADAYFAELAQGRDVVALAYHVDYWDYLGWKDTLASPANTQRQQDYAKALGLRSVYTPQMIVNGRVHMSGSKRAAVEAAIISMHEDGDGLRVPITVRTTPESMIIDIGDMPGGYAKAHVVIAYFDPARQVKIERGENAGRTLTYWNAVSGLQTAGMWHGKAKSIEIPLSDMEKKDAAGCAILLQAMRKDGTPGPILGATALARPSS